MRVIKKWNVETAGENGYPVYRIPGIIATQKGTLVTYYECRQAGDWSVIDIGMKTSADGGATWSGRQIIASGGGKNTLNNPVMFSDGELVHFVWMENYKRAFYKYSADDCKSWSAAVEISQAFEEKRPAYPWTVIAAGPGHGVRLSGGRLIVPVWMASNPFNIFDHQPSVVSTLYSDDRGATWHVGEIIDAGEENSLNESVLGELSGKAVLINMRSAGKNGRRCLAVSASGIDGWENLHFDHRLSDPGCAAGMCQWEGGLLFSNCDSKDARENLTLRQSADDGKSWDGALIERLGGYSDVCWHPASNTAFVVYEHKKYSFINMARITLA